MSNQVKHTAEPWHIRKGSYVWNQQNEIIVSAEHDNGAVGEDEANARRIVACVNACAGIETTELESTICLNAPYIAIAKTEVDQ